MANLKVLSKASLYVYTEADFKASLSYLQQMGPIWADGSLRSDAPLFRVLSIAAKAPAHLYDKFQKDDPVALEFLSCKRAVWELGVSIGILGESVIRADEFVRLTTEKFWTSHYLLYMAAFFRINGRIVSFTAEGARKSPDLKIDEWFVECKERDPSADPSSYFGALFRKSREKFSAKRYQPGVVIFDIDPEHLFPAIGMSFEEHQQILSKAAYSELSRMPNIDAAILTIRRTTMRTARGISCPLLLMTLLNPKSRDTKLTEVWSGFIKHFGSCSQIE